jgi:DNA-directed RNA polymerase specialized sigma24 family protein
MERNGGPARLGGVDIDMADTGRAVQRSAHANGPPGQTFEQFYAGAEGRVYRALAVTLADADLAREATDEAMVRAFIAWSKLSGFTNPSGWVFRVGLNWATSWRRRLRRERPMPQGSMAPTVTAPDAEATAATAALHRLPVAQRAGVVCRVMFDLTTLETADTLHIPPGTVRSRLSRAISALRADLTGAQFEEER